MDHVVRGPRTWRDAAPLRTLGKANAPQNDGDLVVLARSEASYASKLAEAFESEDRPSKSSTHRRRSTIRCVNVHWNLDRMWKAS